VPLLRKGTISRRGGFVEKFGEEELIFQCSYTLTDFYYGIQEVHPSNATRSAVGQSVTPTKRCKLTKVRFYVGRIGSPQGILVARLYKGDESGKPIDDPVNSGILAQSNDFSISDLTMGGADPEEFIFSETQQYIMEKEKTYVVQLLVLSATMLDASNYVFLEGCDDCVSGNASAYQYSAWVSITDEDLVIYVYARPSLG